MRDKLSITAFGGVGYCENLQDHGWISPLKIEITFHAKAQRRKVKKQSLSELGGFA